MSIPVLKMLTVGMLPSPLKVAWYRFRGAKIGKRVKIGLLSVVTAENIEIGDDCSIGLLSFINLRKSFKLGKRVSINSMVAIDTGEMRVGDDTVIMEQVIIGGMLSPRSLISIGKRVKVFPHSFLNPTQEIIIEDDVGIGGSNYIFTHGSWQNVLDGFQASFGPVHIKKNAWLPWRVFVLPGVTIGESAIIGPGAVVNQSVPDVGVAGGVPAEIRDMQGRHIRRLSLKHQDKLVRKILSEYVEFQEYLDQSCVVLSDDESSIAIIQEGKKIVYCIDGSVLRLADCDVMISLTELDQDQRNRFTSENVIWFDLLGKSAALSNNSIALELKNYFSRYGIRFDLIE